MANKHIKLNDIQKRILERLISKYESSKTYNGENQVTQSFNIKPQDVFKQYNSDFVDLDAQGDFERDVKELESVGFIALLEPKGIIEKIGLNVCKVEEINEVLGRIELKAQVDLEKQLYTSYIGRSALIDSFCQAQVDLLDNRKSAKYTMGVAKDLLRLLEYVLTNQDELLERELSIEVFGDSKIFEKQFRSRLISILKEYGEYSEIINNVPDEREQEHAILEELNIYQNPTYVYFKGLGKIILEDSTIIPISCGMPIALESDRLRLIKDIVIDCNTIMTVENLTSYNRIESDKVFYIFLSGYHNSAKQRLIQKIAERNKDKKWFHFGDIDPDGFYILEHLSHKTGILFERFHMFIEDLDKYEHYCKPLEKNDIVKANSLIEKGLYVDEMKYMLRVNRKLEQEVISWKEQ